MSDTNAKTFTAGGTTLFNGVSTFRFTNSPINIRTNMLKHYGHEDIKLVEFPRPMTQADGLVWLMQQGFKGNLPTRAADKNAENEAVTAAKAAVSELAARAAKREAKKAEKAKAKQKQAA